jgi:hypothetical protein
LCFRSETLKKFGKNWEKESDASEATRLALKILGEYTESFLAKVKK